MPPSARWTAIGPAGLMRAGLSCAGPRLTESYCIFAHTDDWIIFVLIMHVERRAIDHGALGGISHTDCHPKTIRHGSPTSTSTSGDPSGGEKAVTAQRWLPARNVSITSAGRSLAEISPRLGKTRPRSETATRWPGNPVLLPPTQISRSSQLDRRSVFGFGREGGECVPR